ncbi:MAG TPA: prolyl oligopeptidase family serine peptidase [Candidatus Dormibacteraeota bacterium]|nr:prolyl oligopeptidase family serine peptidase [Candidatus Dormibacteraeota bacterium]
MKIANHWTVSKSSTHNFCAILPPLTKVCLSRFDGQRVWGALGILTLVVILVLLVPCQARPQAAPPHIPPPGIALPESDRKELETGAASLRGKINDLAKAVSSNPELESRLPDLEIFHKAVDWVLRYDEFFDAKQISFAKKLLTQGDERANQLRSGQTPWLQATGLVVRGYRSKLDGSVQPYGLVIPANWKPDGKPRPLYVWLAGRNEKRTELAFLNERESSPGQLVPPDALILHPYGRFCNATKFAGEVDVFEAMADVGRQYLVDSNRLVVAGFSMGGASVWHLAVHHSGLWCAASPGAGFAETPVYSKVFADGKEPPPWWEQKLWRWYDATDYAGNLFNCPTIAYSGEIDPQKQSADIMEKAMAGEGLKLERLIGPQTPHKYHPQTLKELASRLDALTTKGKSSAPDEIHLTTYTLQYPEAGWVRIEGLEKHWERADVRAKLEGAKAIIASTNVSALRLSPPGIAAVLIDGQQLRVNKTADAISLRKRAGQWAFRALDSTLRKRPGLTGPVDDAFMSPFLFVRPTGKAITPELGHWTETELASAVKMWRDVFRGVAPVKEDKEISDDDIASKNLILWGDPKSNKALHRIISKLPLTWSGEKLRFNGKTYDAANHVPILIFPNPLNPNRYILLNSGIDFRTDAYGSNAKQTPKLPDYAIVDVRTPADAHWPGKIEDAGFFDEQWQAGGSKSISR